MTEKLVGRPLDPPRGPPPPARRRPLPRRPRPRRAGRRLRPQPRSPTPASPTSTSPPPLDVPGLVAVYTYEDLPPRVAEPLPLLIPHPDLTHPRTAYCLAKDEVNHVGEAVVMVVAADRYAAEDAAELIEVAYEELPPVVGIADRARRRRPRPRRRPRQRRGRQRPGERRRPRRRGRRPAPPGPGPRHRAQRLDAAWRARASTPPGTPRTAPCAAQLHPDLDQRPRWPSPPSSSCRRTAVEVVTPDVGGAFGVKIVHPWPEEILVPWAARLLGRDVKWVEDRREHFVSSAHERGQLQHIEVGFDDDGRVLGMDVEIWHDNGAYTPYGVIVPDRHHHPAARALQARRLPREVHLAVHEHRPGHPLPRRRTPAGRVRHGADHGRHRGVPRARTASPSARPT